MLDPATQSALFPELISRAIEVRFDEPSTTSDGGALLLKSVDEEMGLSEALGSAMREDRDRARLRHELGDLFRQRAFGVALGYADGNDV